MKDVLDKMDFEPMVASELARVELPTEEELEILRVYIYPRGGAIDAGNWIEL